MKIKTSVEIIGLKDVLPMRQKSLKPFLTIDECKNPEDAEAPTFHLGLFMGKNLVAISSFSYQSCRQVNAGCPFRVRGMATDEKYRGQGFGEQLLRTGIELLKGKKCDLVWCNSRITATQFYAKLGFRPIGDIFELPGIGPHKVMYKIINPR